MREEVMPLDDQSQLPTSGNLDDCEQPKGRKQCLLHQKNANDSNEDNENVEDSSNQNDHQDLQQKKFAQKNVVDHQKIGHGNKTEDHYELHHKFGEEESKDDSRFTAGQK